MMRSPKVAALAVGATAATLVAVAVYPASAAGTTTHHTGTLADGATWIADVPANWNGTLVLFSHGFGPLTAQDAPSAQSGTALLAQGYALAGSSYDPKGSLWALNSSVRDQFATLTAFGRQFGTPQRTIASGDSMGGLTNSIIAQDGAGRISGAVTFCGMVDGAVDLTDSELNGEYAITTLLPGASGVQLRDFTSFGQGAASGTALQSSISTAQSTASGRARIALASALLNETDWASGSAAPSPGDFVGQEQQEEQTLTGGQLPFVLGAEAAIEQAVGGDPSHNVGVNYAALLRSSPYYSQIKALYQQAGLDLDADVAALDKNESYTSEGDSLANTERTSTNSGYLPIPELDVHTIADQLIPVQQENNYAQRVREHGDAANLRQSYVAAIGHCNFTAADVVAAINTVSARVGTGHWSPTDAATLNAAADKLTGLGGGNFLTYQPTPLVVQPTW
ncbi:DUF6351 family protein [Actinospica sp.]|jgi:hypothetical protein|uniref:DUF6351 family protein n=1 Tax=Actinospica sp. TaxID=1872142 RepID=UPI002C89F959|nr:DUF6351 family protein [Actinospica sp.]HWG28591.1 DUF6351 family protein [Actinospica sp.]